MVWFLLGLLFNAAGLYLGFEHGLSFVYFILGLFCCAYGVSVFVLQRVQKAEKSATTRLSPQFISAGSSAELPASKKTDEQPYSDRPQGTNPAEPARS